MELTASWATKGFTSDPHIIWRIQRHLRQGHLRALIPIRISAETTLATPKSMWHLLSEGYAKDIRAAERGASRASSKSSKDLPLDDHAIGLQGALSLSTSKIYMK